MYEPKKTENIHGQCFLHKLCKAQLCSELVVNKRKIYDKIKNNLTQINKAQAASH